MRAEREALRAAINALVVAAEWHMAEHTLYECRKDERSNRWRDLQSSYVQVAKTRKRSARRRVSQLLRRVEALCEVAP